jgi:hypothetical protein
LPQQRGYHVIDARSHPVVSQRLTDLLSRPDEALLPRDTAATSHPGRCKGAKELRIEGGMGSSSMTLSKGGTTDPGLQVRTCRAVSLFRWL